MPYDWSLAVPVATLMQLASQEAAQSCWVRELGAHAGT